MIDRSPRRQASGVVRAGVVSLGTEVVVTSASNSFSGDFRAEVIAVKLTSQSENPAVIVEVRGEGGKIERRSIGGGTAVRVINPPQA